MKKETPFYFAAGVPYEMKYLVENEIIPKVVKEYERPYIIHKTILTYGQGELISSGLKPGKTASAIFETTCQVRKVVYFTREQAELLEMAIEEYVVSLNLMIYYRWLKKRRSSFDMLKEKVKPFLQLRVAREVKSLRY
jgi:nicotinamide-nucleotide amidase